MNQYLCKFYVNGVKTEEVVTAKDGYLAKKIIAMKYPSCKISWIIFPQKIK